MKFDAEILRWLFSQDLDEDSVMRYDEGGVLYFSLGGDKTLRFNCSKPQKCLDGRIVPIEKVDLEDIVTNYELYGVQLVGSMCYVEGDELTVMDTIKVTREKIFVLRYLEKNQIDYDHYEIHNRACDNPILLWGADIGMEFGYFIDLNEKVWQNKEKLQLLLDILTTGSGDVYTEYFHEEINLKKLVSLPIIGTNTKVRRLCYIKKFIELFDGTMRLPEVSFEKRLREKLPEYNEELLQFKNTKGIIQDSQFKASVRPYIDLASSLGILTSNKMGVELGKLGILYQKMLGRNLGGFEMSLLDKSMFLESILKNDYLYIYCILEFTFVTDHPTYHGLRDVFKQRVVDYLDGILKDDRDMDSRDINTVKLLKKRIQEWSKPEVYLEHVLMPRLNWLYDLDIIELNPDLSFHLSKGGERLLAHMESWLGVNYGHTIVPTNMIEKYYMRVFNDIYDVNAIYYKPKASELLEELLNESFCLFRTLAPNRVTYSMFVGYAKRKLLLEYKIIMDEAEIRNDFLSTHTDKYIFKYQEYYLDGYVQLK